MLHSFREISYASFIADENFSIIIVFGITGDNENEKVSIIWENLYCKNIYCIGSSRIIEFDRFGAHVSRYIENPYNDEPMDIA